MLEVLRSGRLSLGPMGERFERDFADWLGVEDAVAVSSGTAALHLGVRQLGWGAGRRGPDQPLQLRRLGQLPALRGGAAGLLRRRPGDAQPRPGRRGGGGRRAHRRHPADPHLRLPGGDAGARARWPRRHGLGILEDACEALGAVDSEGRRVGTRGNLATFAFYANKQMTTGEGGMIVPDRRRASAARLRSERNQGRAVDMGWLDHDRLGFNYRLSDVAAAIGVAQVEKLDSMLERRAGGRRALRARGWPGSRASRTPIAGARRRAAQLVRLPGPARPTASTATRRSPRLRRARHRQQGLPALHPPLPAPARARLPRGPVPGRRSRRGRLAGAAVLPRAERGTGGTRLPGAGRGPRPSALTQ